MISGQLGLSEMKGLFPKQNTLPPFISLPSYAQKSDPSKPVQSHCLQLLHQSLEHTKVEMVAMKSMSQERTQILWPRYSWVSTSIRHSGQSGSVQLCQMADNLHKSSGD